MFCTGFEYTVEGDKYIFQFNPKKVDEAKKSFNVSIGFSTLPEFDLLTSSCGVIRNISFSEFFIETC